MRTGLILALLLFLYPFVIYPALLRLVMGLKRRRRDNRTAPSDYPSVALVICALNEQRIIGQKMANCLRLRYPEDKLRIVVVSDGSTDRTAAIVREYASDRIQLIERTTRRGKVANLNEVIPSLSEDIVILSDANVIYDANAVLRLVQRLSDPSVGCVSGRVILTDTAPKLEESTGQYYSLEWFLQKAASEIYSMPGADGAMYALRRELFRPCPNDTIVEDFVIPMSVVRQGRRVVFERGAVGWEQGPGSIREEFRRKIRIAAGSAYGLLRGNAWPGRAPLRFWFIFVSHKLLRWLSPATGAAVLLLALANMDFVPARLLLFGFAAMCALAALRILTGWRNVALSGAFYFLFGQVAVAIGLVKGIAGTQTVLWAKVDR
jgi:cellulose synthase/poly-beta-1,6-N-acetylglucosamine synthase-like glycosyltransferase